MSCKSNNSQLVQRVQELEAVANLWIAANEAKDQHIATLEAECRSLRQRVARLTRQVGRRQQHANVQRVSIVR